MKKEIYLAYILAILFSQSFIFANEACNTDNPYCKGHFAIEGTIATGGNIGIGLIYYAPRFELGVTASGYFNNAHDKGEIITPVIFGGLRKYLNCETVFAYGVNVVGNYGKIAGRNIDFSYISGFYISLEYYLRENVLLVGWIDPYAFETTKLEHSRKVNTNHIFNTGGIGLSYLW